VSKLTLALLLLASGPVSAQSVTGRWSLQIRGPATIERGDLRLEPGRSRILLESADSVWQAADSVVISGNQISFRVPIGNRRFTGEVTRDRLEGSVIESDGRQLSWQAQRVQAGIESWPVRPKLMIRQLIVGDAATTASFPDVWRNALAGREVLLAEHTALAAAAGFPLVDQSVVVHRIHTIALGFDPIGRATATALLQRIEASSAVDAEFRQIFRGSKGQWRIDIHDRALEIAQAISASFQIGEIAASLRTLGFLAPGDSSGISIQRAAWVAWNNSNNDPQFFWTQRALTSADDDLVALFKGYQQARPWWTQALRWLMIHEWIETSEGYRSPSQLVSDFWGVKDLSLPKLEPTTFGVVQAVPVIGADRLGSVLLRPMNASGAEWLARPGAARTIFAAWPQVETQDLPVMIGGTRVTMTTPSRIARTRLGGFFGAEDAIRIESGIIPLFAVGTVVHEWQHLLFEASRLEGPGTPGVISGSWGIRLLESDPWLSEGAAEWATDEVLAPARAMTPYFAFQEAEKRLAIGWYGSEDTHVLGYLLVRAAAERVADVARLRRLLVAKLHSSAEFAELIGLAGPSTRRMARPATLMAIPEISFTWDDNIADNVTRRLIIPDSPLEFR
jgi:hypothetical protein